MVVKELVENPSKAKIIMSTAITLRLISGLIAFAVCVTIFYFLKGDEPQTLYVGIILALTLIAQALISIELYYQSKVASRIAVISQSVAYIIANVLKVVLILSGASLIAFAVVTALEMTLGGLFMLYSLKRFSKQSLAIALDKVLAKDLMVRGWPLIFSGFMIMIYMRIDQIMLGEMVNDHEVGMYSAALKISEIWYIIPAILCNSFFPSIIDGKKLSQKIYFKKFQRLFDILFLISLAIAIGVTIFSDLIIDILYGEQYSGAALILTIHIWAAVFVFLGVGGNNFFIIENLQIKTFTRTALGAIANIILNMILIPKYLAVGAAIATLISQFLSSYAFDLLSRKTYVLFKMKTRSMLGINYVLWFFRKSH